MLSAFQGGFRPAGGRFVNAAHPPTEPGHPPARWLWLTRLRSDPPRVRQRSEGQTVQLHHQEHTAVFAPIRFTRTPAQLEALARRIAERSGLWQARVLHVPEQRSYFRLFATAEVEAWVLSWTRAQGIELHDHGGAAGAVLVLEGELMESYSDIESQAPLRRAHWSTGSAHSFGPGHVHDLHHVGPRPATSIHVYSPPLTSMTFYDHRPGHFLQSNRVEEVSSDATPGRGLEF